MLDDVHYVDNGAIIGWNCGVAGEEEMAACLASRFGITEIAGVFMYREYHAAGITCENIFFLCSQVIEELVFLSHVVFVWRGGL